MRLGRYSFLFVLLFFLGLTITSLAQDSRRPARRAKPKQTLKTNQSVPSDPPSSGTDTKVNSKQVRKKSRGNKTAQQQQENKKQDSSEVFFDRDGDGIHDGQEHRFRGRHRRNRHGDGTMGEGQQMQKRQRRRHGHGWSNR